MVLHWRLDFLDGNFTLVDAPPMSRSRSIQSYYQELKRELQQFGQWLYVGDPAIVDQTLYPTAIPYYQAIALNLTPNFNPANLLPLSRYRFFVATESVEYPDHPHPVPGLSGLEQILGFKYQVKHKGNDSGLIQITSGDVEIDLMADMLIVFKEQAIALRETYPIELLSLLLSQASDRMKGESATTEKQKERDKLAFEKNQAAIAAEFRKSSGGMPF